MKRFIIICLALFFLPELAETPVFKRSFFTTIQSFRPSSPEIVSMSRDRLVFCCDNKQMINVYAMGGMSIDDFKPASYFTPNSYSATSFTSGELGSNLVAKEDNSVVANYFNILTGPIYTAGDPANFDDYTFESKVSFAPTQDFFAMAFEYRRHLSPTPDVGWWFSAWVPIKWIRNNLHMKETIIKSGGPGGNDPEVPAGFVANMTEAFKQSKFKYGKIDGAQSAFGVADIYMRIGTTYFQNDSRHMSSYFGAIIPTSNKPTAEYMFEPIYGNNGHAGVFSGVDIGFRVWHDCSKAIYWELDTSGMMLLQNTQTRSFDLKDKTWGRYMWVYLSPTASYTSPGINVFTKLLDVTPGTSRDLNLAFTLEHKKYRAELGYHYYARAPEQITLHEPFCDNVAIATIVDADGNFVGASDPKTSRDRSTVQDYSGVLNDSYSGTDVYRRIEQSDLDLGSAAHPGTVTHGFYAAASFHWCLMGKPMYGGLAVEYENSSDNTALDRILFWGKFGVEF